MASKSDKIFQKPFEEISDFRFDSGVVEVFEDMIERSVPGYSAILGMTGELSEQFAQANTCIYDLGCSLGGSSLSIAQRHLPEGVSIIALDSSEPMIQGLQQKLNQIEDLQVPVEIRQEDICSTDFQTSSFVVLNFTLQFVSPDLRSDLIQNIYRSLVPGGALLLSEKVRFEDKKTEDLVIDLHHKFKKSMGYSDLEIAQKRTAIENILVPESVSTHHQRLEDSGFAQVTTWFQCFNFCSFLAVKPKLAPPQ